MRLKQHGIRVKIYDTCSRSRQRHLQRSGFSTKPNAGFRTRYRRNASPFRLLRRIAAGTRQTYQSVELFAGMPSHLSEFATVRQTLHVLRHAATQAYQEVTALLPRGSYPDPRCRFVGARNGFDHRRRRGHHFYFSGRAKPYCKKRSLSTSR